VASVSNLPFSAHHYSSISRLLYISAALALVCAAATVAPVISQRAPLPASSTNSQSSAPSAGGGTRHSSPESSDTVEVTASATAPTIPEGELSLSDFDQIKGKWKEDSYDVEGASIPGLGTVLRECDSAELGLTLLLPNMKLQPR
jgi:hypothetical protein